MEISKIRFWCNTHHVPLKNCGNGRIFYPTFTTVEDAGDEMENRKDAEGWLTLDTSEMCCPASDECDQDWSIQGE